MTRPTGGRRAPLSLVWLMGVVLAVVVGGCGVVPPPPVPAAPGPVGEQLEALTVVPRPRDDGTYRRAAFGRAWADVDLNGCRQRADSLWRTADRSKPFTVRTSGRCTHEMTSGTWRDPYTGQSRTFTNLRDPRQAQDLPVDHTVALAVFWRYGANRWTDQQRLNAANDLDNLVPTSAKVNSSKGGLDAASWRPPKYGQCGFATRYVTIKGRYHLGVDTSEKAALRQMLATCTRDGHGST